MTLIFHFFHNQKEYPPRDISEVHSEEYADTKHTDTHRVGAPQTVQRETLTAAQRGIFDTALEQAGFQGYKSLAVNKDGWVEVVYEVPPAVIAGQALAARMTLEEYLEHYASGAVRAVKGALPFAGIAADTPCRVRLQGPNPEPGVIGAYGWATFTDQLSWEMQEQ